MTGRPLLDTAEVRRLQRHLSRVVLQARRDTRVVMMRGALNIKNEWKANARASSGRHAPAYPRSIGFDLLAFGPDQLLAIIGPDKGSLRGARQPAGVRLGEEPSAQRRGAGFDQ
ncbi:hypothetical protein [Streptomyces microflavus]|uniref:hypothetical protein n=1 Tax=Streptomyces microflavus TaxID=1919 RepID=UPI003B20E5FE